MTKKKFEGYVHSKQWKLLRSKVLERDNHSCQYCGSKNKLIVHHLTYERLFNENMEDLITFCKKCHIKFHQKNKFDVPIFVRKTYYEEERTKLNIISFEEFSLLISKSKKEDTKFYIKLAFLLCLKVGEIANLKKEDINVDKGLIKIKDRIVPIIDLIEEQINSFLSNNIKILGVRSIEKKIKKLSKYILKRDIDLNSLRHSGAVFYYDNGMPIELLSKFLGHNDLKNTAELYCTSLSYIKTIKKILILTGSI